MNQGLIKLSKQVFNFRLIRFFSTSNYIDCDEFSTTSNFCVKNILEQDKIKNSWIHFEGDPADMTQVIKNYKEELNKMKDYENENENVNENVYENYENYGNTNFYKDK
jgi:hypothetical protein